MGRDILSSSFWILIDFFSDLFFVLLPESFFIMDVSFSGMLLTMSLVIAVFLFNFSKGYNEQYLLFKL